MGQSSDATVREIEDIRGRLETNFQELERRLPAPAAWAKRIGGIAIGGGAGALLVRSLLKRTAKHGAKGPAVEASSKASAGGGWKPLLVLGAGALIALQVIELRQIRRLSEATRAGR